MREIGKHNYEELFFDYHEGLLNEEEKARVKAFLLKYPELQEDFDAFGETVLHAPPIELDWKESLKKSETGLSSEEEKIIAVAEGLLDIDGLKYPGEPDSDVQEDLRVYRLLKLRAAGKTYPNKAELKASMNSLPLFLEDQLDSLESKYSLEPDLSESLPFKNSLKKGSRGIIVYLNSVARVAAAVAVLIALAWFTSSEEQTSAVLGSKVEGVEFEKRLAETGSTAKPIEENEVIEANSNLDQFASKEEHRAEQQDKRKWESIERMNKRKVRELDRDLIAKLALPEPHTKNNIRTAQSEPKQNIAMDKAKSPSTANSAPKETTLAQFAKRKLSQSLVSKPDPEEGLVLAVLDKAVEKLDERSERKVDLELSNTQNDIKGFELSIGKLKIKR